MDDDDMTPVAPMSEMARQAVAETAAGTAVLLDVRSDEEWDDIRAEGAQHWSLARLKAGEMPDIPQDTRVYTHCVAGARAEEAKELLIAHGFSDVINIGGLEDWQRAGGEIE